MTELTRVTGETCGRHLLESNDGRERKRKKKKNVCLEFEDKEEISHERGT